MMIIIITPLFVLYVYLRSQQFRYNMGHELKKCGLDKESIKVLKKETIKMTDIFKMLKKTDIKTLSI